ncbi:MAG: rubrerythrin family protein [Actinobacteria bacterium]|nr:MAG: rubrerythrin family protein [Actinomycetota bacterium]
MSTQDNLKEAFAGESQANRRYTAFAEKAEEEGHPHIARLFRAAAKAETVHALEHLRVLGEVGDTRQNLKEAIAGETHEFQSMYPGFIREAEAEGSKAALYSFRNANAVEEIHAGLFSKALAGINSPVEVAYYVCPVCGNTVENAAPQRCPICNTPGEKFSRIE